MQKASKWLLEGWNATTCLVGTPKAALGSAAETSVLFIYSGNICQEPTIAKPSMTPWEQLLTAAMLA